MSAQEFTVALIGYEDISEELVDLVVSAGCDDALLFARGAMVGLDFEREAESGEVAIEEALEALTGVGLTAVVALASDVTDQSESVRVPGNVTSDVQLGGGP